MQKNIHGPATLFFGLTTSALSIAQSESTAAQSGVAVFWNASKCVGGYHSDYYSAHCDPGPAAAILDFNTRTQFFCINNQPVEIRWTIPEWPEKDPKRGSPIAPSQVDWRPECWKTSLEFDVKSNTTLLIPQYTQSPAPNYYMTMNALFLYDASKVTIKICLVPFFPGFPTREACADATIR